MLAPRQFPETLAVIPARGGSKGIPRKNVADLCGRPLISYAIEVARRARRVHRVVVSTDDEEIAAVAREWGAEVPFMRPPEIAGSQARLGDAMDHALAELERAEGYRPDLLAVLCPTHPFRTPRLVDELLGRLAQGYTYVRTMKPVRADALTYFSRSADGTLQPLVQGVQGELPELSQACYRAYGLVVAYHLKAQPLGEYCHPLTDPVQLIDIDTSEDLLLAEEVIRAGAFDFTEQ
jgi:CMP-N-acetylneuraminic acid synthetase